MNPNPIMGMAARKATIRSCLPVGCSTVATAGPGVDDEELTSEKRRTLHRVTLLPRWNAKGSCCRGRIVLKQRLELIRNIIFHFDCVNEILKFTESDESLDGVRCV